MFCYDLPEKLKPCPFCGSEARLHELNGYFSVVCMTTGDCYATKGVCCSGPDKMKEIQMWNRRKEKNID